MEIRYKYNACDTYPYKALANIGNELLIEVSMVSFAEAREILLEKIQQQVNVVIPEPEQITDLYDKLKASLNVANNVKLIEMANDNG